MPLIIMNQEQLKKIVERYLEGTSSEEEKKMLESWIVLIEKKDRILAKEDKVLIEQRLWNRLSERLKENAGEERKTEVFPIGKRMLRYAALWIGVIVASASGYLLRYRILDVIDPIALKTQETGPYQIKKVLLPDSSVITLGVNSTITYPERYRGIKRYALLKGKAFFNITHNASLPFIVESDELKVKVLGTSFEVANTAGNIDAEVTVVTGKVQVSVKDEPVAILTQNQQATYHKNSMRTNVDNNINAVQFTNWTNNQLIFNETPLAFVLQTIAREYGITIQPGKTTVETGATFSGSFTRGESWKDVLDIVCMSSGLKWTHTTGNVVTVKKAS